MLNVCVILQCWQPQTELDSLDLDCLSDLSQAVCLSLLEDSVVEDEEVVVSSSLDSDIDPVI